jgi:hypothetical protein
MSDWQVPEGYGRQPQPYQWGMAVPPPGYEPVYLVPRPPRPGVVNIALMLTYIGLGLAALQVGVGAAVSWQTRASLSRLSTSGTPTLVSGSNSLVLGIVLTAVLLWLLPGAGAVVTAVLSARGANPARIVLASLMGLFALVNLCQASGGVLGAAATSELSRAAGVSSIYGGWLWVEVALHVIEFGLAVAIGVLLIVPAANRYFSAGPGRRFADGGTEVPSTHDRP